MQDRKQVEDAAPAGALVLFGAMGDLAHKKIFPALYHMVQHGHLHVPVIGVAGAGRTNEHLKERVRDSIQQQGGEIDQETLAKLLKLLRYVGEDYEKAGTFDLLKKTLVYSGCKPVRKRRKLSAKSRAKIAAAQTRRWAKVRKV